MQKKFDVIVKEQLILKFESIVPSIKQKIMQVYDEELIDIVIDRKSKTNPLFYREEFEERLDGFVYVKNIADTVTISVPDMKSFDFSGRLRVLETILEGTAGIYVEISAIDFENVFNKQPVNIDPIDDYVPKKNIIYIVKYNSKIRRAESNILNKKLVRYPFSNSPPIDVLQAGQDYIDNNIDAWVDDSVQKAEDLFAQGFGGVV